MNQNQFSASRFLAIAGGLMTVSGLLMAICGKLAYGGMLWAAAFCMFVAAHHFRRVENDINKEKKDDGKEAL